MFTSSCVQLCCFYQALTQAEEGGHSGVAVLLQERRLQKACVEPCCFGRPCSVAEGYGTEINNVARQMTDLGLHMERIPFGSDLCMQCSGARVGTATDQVHELKWRADVKSSADDSDRWEVYPLDCMHAPADNGRVYVETTCKRYQRTWRLALAKEYLHKVAVWSSRGRLGTQAEAWCLRAPFGAAVSGPLIRCRPGPGFGRHTTHEVQAMVTVQSSDRASPWLRRQRGEMI
jgi:hypothetical protein